ncbi:GTP cyclohydrolase I family protein [Ehrlichia chaffeensis str. Heartland]|uniref:GTP cyclohydrolase 1 n=1 Tax=Ehrlichia chaffeensis (strain ATCC CRL-10679 / Arkansas) TaxID=205920 RepID=Q2GGH3_EHRCR|nr:GTP cyclohydrolase I [Ehrlichia chaffeensis]ABD45285.1 GTP cyclohydrolase I [Ehrlichia chaffeensis str. Arkansas]AHX03731.1 GTP cyclohydrolase I family protein [Ehrlichia chaffeensis str. Heartland]AHX05548.1 GTP cyclohydrolase I family protein [Ehrlichia chaffeensis str. Jax]AHX06538.1 GTP cyclohydrolase I family protein [Ehrlichia chaffeensis str. Liberty]AHX07545.1 GTP cyclohydrolase I family protein [Ehrlichia chaffeensis str. Osceola]
MRNGKPSDSEAEEAVNLLIRWIGDDPNREGLVNTAKRVLDVYKRFFSGYQVDIYSMQDLVLLNENYNDMVIFKNTEFTSYCEHHIVPMRGKISIGYVPDKLVFGVGKIVKLINCFTKRLQLQEKLTVEIANALDHCLAPKGIIVAVEAVHDCIVCCEEEDKHNLELQTTCAIGVFQDNMELRREFFSSIG